MTLTGPGSGPDAKSWKRIGLIALVSLLCAGIILTAINNISFLTRVNQLVQDWEIAGVFAPHEPQDPDIVIVAIDEPTLEQFAYRTPIDRKFLSDLLQVLASRQPRAIGLDVLLDQRSEPEKDAALRQALANLSVPVAVSYIPNLENVSAERIAFENEMVPPRARALPDTPTDQFDTARFVFPGAKVGKVYVPGFARALAGFAGIETPAIQTPIVWRGRPAPTSLDPNPKPFLQVSARVAGLMPASWFRGKIVLIGSDLTLVDRHRTPYSSILEGDAGQLPGIVIQAHGVSQLLHGRPQPQFSWASDLAAAFLLALLGAMLGAGDTSLWLRIPLLALLAVLFWAGGVALFHYHGVMMGLLAPPLAMVAGFTALDVLDGRSARAERKFIRGAMARYVSPDLVKQMVDDPSRLALLGERRMMTFLFSDIQDFTTMSEKMDSRDLAQLLNGYLDGMTEIVLRHGGMVDKFIGDAVFAIFNAPLDLPEHAQMAVQCMLEMDDFTEHFRRAQNALGFALGPTRIGVHTGQAVIGNFGSQARFTYTAQGDAVNTASRLEGMNKYFGTRLCVSDATRILCKAIRFRPVASVVMKGKTQALDLWEPLHEGIYQPQFLAAYERAYDRLRAGEPDAAALFAALAAERPGDPCTLLHIRRLDHGETGVKMVMSEK